MIHRTIGLAIGLVLVFGCSSVEFHDSLAATGDAAGAGVDTVAHGASAIGGAAAKTIDSVTDNPTAAEARAKIDAVAKATISRLLAENSAAAKLYNIAYGYAVFDTRKISIMITTGFGAGVAVAKPTGRRTYMKMASGGVNLGVGGVLYQLVFLFEDAASLARFVDNGWEAGADANATLGETSISATPRFVEGMAVYQLTEAGVMLDLNFTGTKYWKDSDLNGTR